VKNQEKKQLSDTQSGVLYVVSTPIGNLGDITFRAIDVLKSTPYIAVEKKSHTQKLLNHYRIDARYISYREENRVSAADKIIRLIFSGHDVALVSDAGTPGISDPGHYLIEQCISYGISVVPIPGVSSALAALTKSGFSTDQFVFIGFLPRKGKKRTELLKEIAKERRTVIVFESPRRTIKTLLDMDVFITHRPVALCRELTKIHETCLRGTVRELTDILNGEGGLKGEIVLIISGLREDYTEASLLSDEEMQRLALDIVMEHPGEKTGALATLLSRETGIQKSRAYTMILEARQKKD
jgi:16S rRNA (cytidine1402-2'-O)-methyltransferase